MEEELIQRLKALQQQYAMEHLRKAQTTEGLWTTVGVTKGLDMAIQEIIARQKQDEQEGEDL